MKNSPAAVPHILLIDDNRDGLLIRRSLLEDQGYKVEVAASGEEGLERFQASKFDVVVTDYRMPRMNGVEVIRGIRAIRPDARIALLSGFVEPLGLTEENTGADAVIAKSANEPTHLTRAIKRLLSPVKRKPPVSQSGALARSRRAAAR
jgi:CheY-like chemotaxis protein